MAGKRMKLNMNMHAFSTIPVDKRTLLSWQYALESSSHLGVALKGAMIRASEETLSVNWMNPKLLGSIVEIAEAVNPGGTFSIRTRYSGTFAINGFTERQFLDLRIRDTAQAEIHHGVWIMMILGTWRAMNDHLVGPIVGCNFNITIPGIVATCLRLGVPIEFEGE